MKSRKGRTSHTAGAEEASTRRSRLLFASGAVPATLALLLAVAAPTAGATATTAGSGAIATGATATGATATAATAVAPATVARALAIVGAFRGAGPLRSVSVTSSPPATPTVGAGGAAAPPRTEIDATDNLGQVVIGVTQPSPTSAFVTAWAGGTTSWQWSFDPSSTGAPVAGPADLATTVTQVAIRPAASPGPAPSAQGPSAVAPAAPAPSGSAAPDTTIALCLVAAVAPALQGSGYGPLITFSGAVGFCTASPVTITDTLILWQYKGGGYQSVGSSQAGGTNSDTDGSVVPCYSPWSTYYGFHSQMIVTLYYDGGVGYGYANSTTASLNCDH